MKCRLTGRGNVEAQQWCTVGCTVQEMQRYWIAGGYESQQLTCLLLYTASFTVCHMATMHLMPSHTPSLSSHSDRKERRGMNKEEKRKEGRGEEWGVKYGRGQEVGEERRGQKWRMKMRKKHKKEKRGEKWRREQKTDRKEEQKKKKRHERIECHMR